MRARTSSVRSAARLRASCGRECLPAACSAAHGHVLAVNPSAPALSPLAVGYNGSGKSNTYDGEVAASFARSGVGGAAAVALRFTLYARSTPLHHAAIRFVLGDAFGLMRADSNASLLYVSHPRCG